MTLCVHYWPTPNGKKVTIFLEEAQIPYRIVPCDIGRGDQFETQFLKLNPNNRMPVLVDDEPLGGGGPISVFESGAILLYPCGEDGALLAARAASEVRSRAVGNMADGQSGAQAWGARAF
jgi:GST-like protein